MSTATIYPAVDSTNPFTKFVRDAAQTTRNGFAVVAEIVGGADTATKITKFAKATITAVAAVFINLAAVWKDLASRLGGFAEVTDVLLVFGSVKELFDLALGKTKGWIKQAGAACLAAFRILATFQFLDRIKLISLGSVLDKVGSIPVFGTAVNALLITGLSFLTIENIKKLTSKKEALTLANARLDANKSEYMQARCVEKIVNSKGFFVSIHLALTETSKKFKEEIVDAKPNKNAENLFKELDDLAKGLVDVITPEGEVKESDEVRDHHKDLQSIKPLVGRISSIFGKLQPRIAAAADLKVVKKTMPLLISLDSIAENSKSKIAIEKIEKAYEDAFIAKLKLEPTNDLTKIAKEAEASKEKDAVKQEKLDGERSKIAKLTIKRTIKSLNEKLNLNASERGIAGFHAVTRKTLFAKDSLNFKIAEKRSLIVDTIDKVVKILFMTLLTIGLCGIAIFAATNPIMIALALFSATIALTKVVYDKLYKNQAKLKDFSPLEESVIDMHQLNVFEGNYEHILEQTV